MEIRDIFNIAKKWWLMITLLTVVALLGAGAVSYFILQNTYESSAVMMITSLQDKQTQALSLNDYTLSTKLVNSYKVLCKTDRVLNQVVEQTKLPMTTKKLADEITVSADIDTQIIRIAVQNRDSNTAAMIANTVATVFVKQIDQIMGIDNVKIIDEAQANPVPVKPNRMMIIAVAGLLGIMAGIGIALLIEYFDISVKTPEQLAELVGAPVLGTIPHISEKTSGLAL